MGGRDYGANHINTIHNTITTANVLPHPSWAEFDLHRHPPWTHSLGLPAMVTKQGHNGWKSGEKHE